MQIIHDSNAVFDVTVDPFLREINIVHLPTKIEYIWEYDDIDEWVSHSFLGDLYDFHLLYEDKLEFSAYEWDEEPKYDTHVPINLYIKF